MVWLKIIRIDLVNIHFAMVNSPAYFTSLFSGQLILALNLPDLLTQNCRRCSTIIPLRFTAYVLHRRQFNQFSN